MTNFIFSEWLSFHGQSQAGVHFQICAIIWNELRNNQPPVVRILSWQMMRCFSSWPKSEQLGQWTAWQPLERASRAGVMPRWLFQHVSAVFLGIISSEVDQLGTSGDDVSLQLVWRLRKPLQRGRLAADLPPGSWLSWVSQSHEVESMARQLERCKNCQNLRLSN